MHDIIVVEQEDRQQHHLWMMNPTKVVILIAESLVEKEIPFLSSMVVIKTYNVQLLENLIYLGLHPPKHKKLYPCENFHFVNTCHLHIGQ
jgi:hypothetical protein